ncbi:hypothetical protein F4677DRAFT_191121 [Hypoxylon crocopeplum]|nr:hypothetical protein F4677DRAFT_191121 [Hypoxylon crocopeplum]
MRYCWIVMELWLDHWANPRITLVGRWSGSNSILMKIDGKWLQVHEPGRIIDVPDEEISARGWMLECGGRLRDLVARSHAHNKERLLELIDRNTAIMDAEEEADTVALFEELPSPEVLDMPDYVPPRRIKMDIWRANFQELHNMLSGTKYIGMLILVILGLSLSNFTMASRTASTSDKVERRIHLLCIESRDEHDMV